MKALQFTEYGNRGSIALVDVDPPAVGPTQVRVAVGCLLSHPSNSCHSGRDRANVWKLHYLLDYRHAQ